MDNQPLTNNQQLDKLPNAVAVLVLGICSILFGCVLVGFVCGIVGLALSKTPMNMYRQNPQRYMNYGVLNAGRCDLGCHCDCVGYYSWFDPRRVCFPLWGFV